MFKSKSSDQVKMPILKKVVLGIFFIWLLLYLFVWAFSPMVVRYFAAQTLADLHLQLEENSNVRLNPFTSTISLDAIRLLDSNGKAVLALGEGEISLHLHRLILSQIYVSEFTLANITIDVLKQNDEFFVAGIDVNASQENKEEAPAEPAAKELAIDFILPELNIVSVDINALIDGVTQTVSLHNFSLTDLFANKQDQSLQMFLRASINDAPFELDSQIELSNLIGEVNSSISLQGFSLASIAPMLAEQDINASGTLSFEASPIVTLGEQTIQIANDQSTLRVDNLLLNTQSIVLEGEGHSVIASDLAIKASNTGKIENLSVNVSTELVKGRVGIETLDNSVANWAGISAQTQVSLVSDETENLLPNIIVPNITFDALHLSEDFSLDTSSPMVSLGKLIMSDIEFSREQLSVDKIQIADLKADIQVNADKSIRSLVDTSGLKPAGEGDEPPLETLPVQGEETTESEESSLVIVLNKLELLNQGVVRVKDESVKPVYDHHLTIETLFAGPFNSSKPDEQSPFELVIIDENYLKIDAKGHVSPFATQLNAELVAKVAELNLPSVSPYVKDGLGFEMKSGQLDVTIEISIENDEIDGNTNVFLRGIEMSSADEVEQGAIKEGKAMPLNAALGMLKDDKGNIDLDVPMRGNISEPSFGIESFLHLILKKAAMSQAQSYLMNTFVPYASVVSVAMSGVDYLLKITFEPLIFDTKESRLKESNTQFLTELALLMKDTPDLQIKTCSVVTSADVNLVDGDTLSEPQKVQLKVLGDERQNNLKRFLVDEGIASNRILYCAPEFDPDENAAPRIELKTD
jgi:hypothetical protein